MDTLTSATQPRPTHPGATGMTRSVGARDPSGDEPAFEDALAALRDEVARESVATEDAAAGDPATTATDETSERVSEGGTDDPMSPETAEFPAENVEFSEANGSAASASPPAAGGEIADAVPKTRPDAGRGQGAAEIDHFNATNALPLGPGTSGAHVSTIKGERLAVTGAQAHSAQNSVPLALPQSRPDALSSGAQTAVPPSNHPLLEIAPGASTDVLRRVFSLANADSYSTDTPAQREPGSGATASAVPRGQPLDGLLGVGSEGARVTDPKGTAFQQHPLSGVSAPEAANKQSMSQTGAPALAWATPVSQPRPQSGIVEEQATARVAAAASETASSGTAAGSFAQSNASSGPIALPTGSSGPVAGFSQLFALPGVPGGDGGGDASLIGADLAILEPGRTGPGQHGATVAAVAEPRAIARQIAEALVVAHENGVDLQLSPEELGRVKLGITQGEAGLIVTVTAERPETLDLLRRHIDLLGGEFAALGLGNTTFSFHDPNRDSGASAPQDALPEADAEGAGGARGPDTAPHAQRLARADTGSLDIRV